MCIYIIGNKREPRYKPENIHRPAKEKRKKPAQMCSHTMSAMRVCCCQWGADKLRTGYMGCFVTPDQLMSGVQCLGYVVQPDVQGYSTTLVGALGTTSVVPQSRLSTISIVVYAQVQAVYVVSRRTTWLRFRLRLRLRKTHQFYLRYAAPIDTFTHIPMHVRRSWLTVPNHRRHYLSVRRPT